MNYKKILSKEYIESIKNKTKVEDGGESFSIDFHQHELKIQKIIKDFFESNLKEEIIEERENNILELQGHDILIKNDLLQNIKNVNINVINRLINKYPELDENSIQEKFLNDFIYKFDKIGNDNIKLYSLIFDLSKKEVEFTLKNGEIIIEKYQVLDLVNYNNNIFKIVQEKKLIYKNKVEYIDFAEYIGGIPIYGIEVKTPKTGLNAALKDMNSKPTYGFFIAMIGTNGTDTFINSSKISKQYFLWENYGDNNEITNIGLYDISKELLFQKNNAMFYVHQCIFEVNEKEQNKYLKNLRVQQYFVSKKINIDFNKMRIDRKNKIFKPYSKYFKHHTRTGKSLTFKSISSLVFNQYTDLFDKIIFFTHDVSSVLKSVLNEYGKETFNGKEIEKIESKKEYIKTLLDKNNKGMYIVNMQKIPQETIKNIDDRYNVLILIDEVHTHQKGDMAKLREKHFPNASIISATATPVMSKVQKKIIKNNLFNKNQIEPTREEIENIYNNSIIDQTAELQGEKLDEMTPSEAEKLKLIVPLVVSKIKYNVKIVNKFEELEKITNKQLLTKFLNKEENLESILQNIIYSYIEEQKILKKEFDIKNKDNKEKYKNFINLPEYDIFLNIDKKEFESYLNDKKMNIELDGDILPILFSELKQRYKEYEQKNKNKIEKKLKKDFKLSMLDTKLNIITTEIKNMQENLKDKYIPKSFWVVGSIAEAMQILIKIKEKIRIEKSNENKDNNIKFDDKQNIYKNIRFAVDISDFNNMNDEDLDELKEIYGENYQPEDINGKIITAQNNSKETDIIGDFESLDNGSVDVLILVKKRMMGYDNANLTMVFIDRVIQDVKEMLQISTRGTTKMQNKDAGYMIDLTLEPDNIETFQNTYALYDNADLKKVILDDLYLEKVYNSIEKNILSIQNLFKKRNNNKIKELSQNNILWYSDELIQLYNKEKNDNFVKSEFLYYMKELNKNMKDLISPKYQFLKDNKEYLYNQYEILLDINSYLYKHILNKNNLLTVEKNTVNYTVEEVKLLIEDIFSIFNKTIDNSISKIEDLINNKNSNYSKENKTISKEDEKIITNLKNEKIYKKVASLKRDEFHLRDNKVFSYFENLIEKIGNRTITEEEYQKMENIIDNQLNDIKTNIKNNYNNIAEYYILDTQLLKLYEKDFEKYDNKFFKFVINEMAKHLANEIIISINKHNDLKDDILIEQIIKDLNLSSWEYLKNIIGIENLKQLKFENEKNWLSLDDGYKKIFDLSNNNNFKLTYIYQIIQRILTKDEYYGI
jgi:hypothetical protein